MGFIIRLVEFAFLIFSVLVAFGITVQYILGGIFTRGVKEKIEDCICFFGLVASVLFLFWILLMALSGVTARFTSTISSPIREQTYISLAPRESEPICGIILEGEDLYRAYVYDICEDYPQVDPDMIQAMIYHESRWQPDATNYNGTCVGLMQLSTKWQTERAEQLGGTDLWDPYTNILTGVDLMAELIDRYEDPALALMMYHMRHDRARELYDQGILSGYTKSVLAMTDELKGVV